MNEENVKVLVITGRETTEPEFMMRVAPYLYDNFQLRGIYALGSPEEIDDTEWFIAFVSGVETENWTVESQEQRIGRKNEKGRPLVIDTFDDMDEALEHAQREYSFEYGEQIQAFRGRAREVFEKFGYATAIETEKFMGLIAYANSGMLVLTRGLLSDVKVPVVGILVEGSDTSYITPVAVLISEEMRETLELPVERQFTDEF